MDSGTEEIYARACEGKLRGISHELLMEIMKVSD